ncbi:MAG TPA: hypothetical protein DIV86_05355, partial [Alphaproteobacteria bacterium]|nr:hypothetical protein [Alphaproteobacteria bacterium]
MASALTLVCSSNLILPTQTLANNIKQADNNTFQQKYSLDEVIKRVLSNSPTLKSQRAETFATEGEYKQSRSYVNPQATIEAEDFEGNGIYKGYNSAQTTYGISQQVLVGGKYSAKIRASEQGVKLAYNKFEIAKLELIKTTKIAYAEAVSASENLKIAKEQKKLAEQVLTNVTKRVNAAAEPAFQKSKAEVTLSNAKIELQQAEREAIIAKNNLAQLWGDNNSDYELSTDNFWKYE